VKNCQEEPATLVDNETKGLKVSNEGLYRQVPVYDNEDKPFQDDLYYIKSILDTMVNPVSYKDINGVYREVNEVYARKVVGIPREKIIGNTIPEISKKVSEMFSGRVAVEKKNLLENCKEWIQQDMEILKFGGKRTDEQELIVADGTKRVFIVNKSALSNEKGKVIGILTVMQDVTELRQIEKALKESLNHKDKLNKQLEKIEESYRVIIENTGQMVYDYDIESDTIVWTGSIEKLTGYSSDYFKNSSVIFWIEHAHPEDQKKVLAGFKSLERGEDIQMDLRFRKKDGSYINLEWNTANIKDKKGKVIRNLGVLKDITEQKLARKNLQKSEERYRTAAEQTGQVIFDLNREKGTIEWAGAILEVTGYDSEEFKRFNESVWLESVHPENRTKLLSYLTKSFEEGKKFDTEFRFRKKDGNYSYVEVRGVWLKNDEGNVYRAIGVMKDVTELKQTLEKVEASERIYRSFVQNFHGIAFQADENFIPVFLHGAVEEITGYTEEELMSGVPWKDIIRPDDLSLILKEEEKIRSYPYKSYGEIEYRIIHRDGKIRWVHEVYQKVLGKDGKPESYQGTIYDITERKETEEFLENIEIARQKEIHHRIKNNLQVISSLLDLQAEKFNNRECVKDSEILEAFRESQDRVISIALIHEELHEGGGTDTLNFSQYLDKLIENLFQTYKLGNSDISLNIDLEENIFFDMDTAVPLGIIVNELVSNSLKHAFSGRNMGEIRIKLYRKNFDGYMSGVGEKDSGDKITGFILTVSDDGKGIPESVDIENPKTLGLQLVNILADQLEGKIELKKENETKFVLSFNAKKKF